MKKSENLKTDTSIPTTLRLPRLLEEIAQAGVPLRTMDLVERLGLSKPTVHRLLQTAEAEGFLQRDLDGRSYGPGQRMRMMAVNTISSERLRTARLAILKAVAKEVGETCNLAAPDREGMIYLDRVETEWPLRIQLPVGTQVPFHCTATGKLYLSTLRKKTLDGFLAAGSLEAKTGKTITSPEELRQNLIRIAEAGYSTDGEEFMEGMAAVAVPVEDQQGRMAAALSIHAPIQRHNLSSLKKFLGTLREGAEKLSNLMTD